MVAADARTAVTVSLSPNKRKSRRRRAYPPDAPEGRKLLRRLGRQRANPPLKTRREPWEHDRESYKRGNEIERLFRRLKGFRRIFSRFEKLDALFLGFIHVALIYDAVR